MSENPYPAPQPDPRYGPSAASAGQTYEGQPYGGQPVSGQTGIGPQPGTDLASDLGAAFSFAGRAMLRNPVTYLVSGIIYGILIVVVTAIAIAAGLGYLFSQSDAMASDELPLSVLIIYMLIIGAILLLLVPIVLFWESGAGRAAEIVREGGRPSIGQAMIGPGRVMLTALLVGLIVSVASLLLYIPGLIASVLLFYAIPAAVRGASPVEAIKQSVSLARANLGTTIVAWLVMSVASSIAGSIIIGIVIAIPFSILFQLGMHERVSGRSLPEPARG